MNKLPVLFALLVTFGFGSIGIAAGAYEEDWSVRLVPYVDDDLCSEAKIYLSVRDESWARVAETELPISDVDYADSNWRVAFPGRERYTLYAETTACSGKRSSSAETTLGIVGTEIDRNIYLFVHFVEGTSEILHLEMDTNYDGSSRLKITQISGSTSVTNISDLDFELCKNAYCRDVRVQYLIEGEWVNSTFLKLPTDISTLRKQAPASLVNDNMIVVSKYVPPGRYEREVVEPTAKRFMLFGQPPVTSWWRNDTSWRTAQAPFCDAYYVNVPLSEDEPTLSKDGTRLGAQTD